MHITKKMGCSVNGGNTGYDLSKYTDIEFSSNCSVSYLYLLQLIRYDSILVRSGLISILMTQIGKYIFLYDHRVDQHILYERDWISNSEKWTFCCSRIGFVDRCVLLS